MNGSQGIGTGWSTSIPPHNPRDLVKYIEAKLDGKKRLPPIRPWVRGFEGTIEIKDDKSGYLSIGKIEKTSRTTLVISELPVGRWTNDYKTLLLRMRDKGEIQSFKENHTTTSVSFTVILKSVQLDRMVKSGLHKSFRLISALPATNMHAFDQNNIIRKYDSAQELVDAYFPTRLALYYERKLSMEQSMKYTALLLRNKCRFINGISDGTIDIVSKRRTKAEAEGLLEEFQFDKMSKLEALQQNKKSSSDDAEDIQYHEESNHAKNSTRSSNEYDYLLNMSLASLTLEKFLKLSSEADKIEDDLKKLKNTSPEELWRADLQNLKPYL